MSLFAIECTRRLVGAAHPPFLGAHLGSALFFLLSSLEIPGGGAGSEETKDAELK